MKEKPILFSAPMVRAILEGRKTQTRRVVDKVTLKCPYGERTETLWVRETWRASSAHDNLQPKKIPVGDSLVWQSINGARPLDENPMVFVIEFKKV